MMAAEAGVERAIDALVRDRNGARCYFDAEGFDCAGKQRLHMHTLSGLLHASHRLSSLKAPAF